MAFDERTRSRWLRVPDWSVGSKIFAAVGLATIVALVTGLLGLGHMQTLRNRAQLQYDRGAVPLIRLDQVRNATLLLRNDITAYCLQPTAAALATQASKVQADGQAVDQALASYRQLGLDATRSQHIDAYEQLDAYEQALNTYRSLFTSALSPVVPGHDLNAIAAARAKMTPLATTMSNNLDALLNLEQSAVAQRAKQAEATADQSTTQLAIVLPIGLLLAFALAIWVRRMIVRQVREVSSGLARMADGDLTGEIPVRSRDEIGQMSAAAATATAGMRRTLLSIEDSAHALAAATGQMTSASQQISVNASRTAEQAERTSGVAAQVALSVETMAAAFEEMGASIGEIAGSAAKASEVGVEAAAEAGAAESHVNQLSEASQAIGQIVKLISGIAEQTNLLALNATIESARAGEAGKGFAVVAGEVKDLAQETAKATADIGARVSAIQAGTSNATSAIERIGAVVGRVNDYQTAIASAVEEQTATTTEATRNVQEAAHAAEEITGNMRVVAETAEASLASVDSTRQAMDEVTRLTEELNRALAGFRC